MTKNTKLNSHIENSQVILILLLILNRIHQNEEKKSPMFTIKPGIEISEQNFYRTEKYIIY
jgi:hypothetical protein